MLIHPTLLIAGRSTGSLMRIVCCSSSACRLQQELLPGDITAGGLVLSIVQTATCHPRSASTGHCAVWHGRRAQLFMAFIDDDPVVIGERAGTILDGL